MSADKKTLAVDFSWLGPTGIGRVAQEVIDRCPSDWRILPIRAGGKNAAPLTPLDLSLQIRKSHGDLFWSPGFMPPLFASNSTKIILTVHDLTHLHYYGQLRKNYYDHIIRPLYRRVDHFITVSDFTRDELVSWSGIDSDRVTMIHNGVSPSFSENGDVFPSDRPYLLYVGNNRPYKNIARLVHAFSTSSLPSRGIMLGLTGNRSVAHSELEKEFNVEGKIKYFGYVPEESLPSLYRGALAVVFISLYEGFGLPIVEAMASGVPVLTSDVSAMPEIAGNAALLVDPLDVTAVSACLERLAFDETTRSSLRQAGLQRVKAFSWNVTGNAYWSVFNRIVKA